MDNDTNEEVAAIQTKHDYSPIVHDALVGAGIDRRLRHQPAVVLERIARGGGCTYWYYCRDLVHLAALKAHLNPGSRVSFYFDNRIRMGKDTDECKSKIANLITDSPEVVIGPLEVDVHCPKKCGLRDLHIEMQAVTHLNDLDLEFTSSRILFFGEYPAPENDGEGAVTIVLPDADGIVRDHPH